MAAAVWKSLWCGVVQWDARYGALRCCCGVRRLVQYGVIVRCGAVRSGAMQCSAVQHEATVRCYICCGSVRASPWCGAVRCKGAKEGAKVPCHVEVGLGAFCSFVRQSCSVGGSSVRPEGWFKSMFFFSSFSAETMLRDTEGQSAAAAAVVTVR